jgi:hypothetical protein
MAQSLKRMPAVCLLGRRAMRRCVWVWKVVVALSRKVLT